jgi:hypothetical protein
VELMLLRKRLQARFCVQRAGCQNKAGRQILTLTTQLHQW